MSRISIQGSPFAKRAMPAEIFASTVSRQDAMSWAIAVAGFAGEKIPFTSDDQRNSQFAREPASRKRAAIR